MKILNATTRLPVYCINLSTRFRMIEDVSNALDSLRERFPDSTYSNLKSVYMSPWHSHELDDRFDELCNVVLDWCKIIYANEFKVDLDYLQLKSRVSQLWGAIYEESDFALKHHHFPCDFAAVFYIDVEQDSAELKLGSDVSVKPYNGLLVIFPAILIHEVQKTKVKRKVIAMNIDSLPIS